TRDGPETPGRPGRGQNPESQRNLRRGVLPSEREAEAASQPDATEDDGPEDAQEEFERDLADVRWVARHRDTKTSRPARQQLQKLLKADPKGFFARKDRLEREARGLPGGGDPEDAAEVKGRCPTCRRFPGQVNPDDPITPDLGNERVGELLAEEWAEIQEFYK